MSWTAYKVAFRLHSPMHVGWRKLGNLQQTRPYLIGRSIWGALTARLTRELSTNEYVNIGKAVDDQLTFTYFYPSVEPDPEGVDLWPWRERWDKFAWTFLGSYASTALKDGYSAEEGSLHETEYIAPYVRREKNVQDSKEVKDKVYLVGYIFEKEGCEFKSAKNGRECRWQDILDRLQLGGERGYGWGRVSLEDRRPVPVTDNSCFQHTLDCSGEFPVITIPQKERVLAHVDTEGVGNSDFIEGTIEPLIGRETGSTGGFGAKFPQARICWMPGSMIRSEQAKAFQIQSKGIWKYLPSQSPSSQQ